jgi:pteridine reductase
MLTKCLAKALAPTIRVNSVAPGIIRFPGERLAPDVQKLARSAPLGRAGDPEDIARTVRFLAASNHFMTGQVLAVDGGRSVA